MFSDLVEIVFEKKMAYGKVDEISLITIVVTVGV